MPNSSKPNAPNRLNAEADASHAGARLDRFLTERLPELSRTRVQALIRDGHVALRGATIEDVKHRVKPGDLYTLVVPPAADTTLRAQAIPLDVVYEDDALIVIDKPAGLVVHPGAGNADGTLVNALIAHCGASLSGIGGVARPGIVHRLDKDTSGLLVVAKTDQAHRGLAKQFADHGQTGELERRYLALVWGAPRRPTGIVDAPIGRHPSSRTKMAVLPQGKGRHAATEWRVVETFGDTKAPVASLIECTLTTGRTHQVRVHLAHIGHPLIGDPLYGTGFKSKERTLHDKLRAKLAKLDRQALHAAHLAFEHPVSGTLLRSDAPNENLARELMELFTLGRGQYTEADVKAAARALAGYTVDWDSEAVGFDEEAAATGPLTILGVTGRFDAARLVDVICDHPACAPFVVTKLYRSFVGVVPTDSRRDELAAGFRDTGLEILPLVEAILRGDEFADAQLNRPRLPIEWFVALHHALGIEITDDAIWTVADLGQMPMYPPNVAGWPIGPQWVGAGQQLLKAAVAVAANYDEVFVDVGAGSPDQRAAAALARCGVFSAAPATVAALEQVAAEAPADEGGDRLLVVLAMTTPEASCA